MLHTCCVPELWKMSCIFPLPQKIFMPDDEWSTTWAMLLWHRHMKVLEWLFLSHLQPLHSDFVFNVLIVKTEGSKMLCCMFWIRSIIILTIKENYVRLNFFFISLVLLQSNHIWWEWNFQNMNVNPNTITWIFNYLTNKSHFVCSLVKTFIPVNHNTNSSTTRNPTLPFLVHILHIRLLLRLWFMFYGEVCRWPIYMWAKTERWQDWI